MRRLGLADGWAVMRDALRNGTGAAAPDLHHAARIAYTPRMTELLEKAVSAARHQSPDVQDRVAKVMLSLMREAEPEPIPPADLEAVLTGLQQVQRGEYATEEEVAAAFRSFDR